MISRSSIDDSLRFLALLARPGDVFELRALSKGRAQPVVHAGYFDDMAKLAAAACDRSGRDDGVYITLNPVNPALLARAPANRVRQAGNGDTTSDRDVQHRRHLLVDVDPVRPTGISSTNDEHAAAIELAHAIAEYLTTCGWPEPIHADSGNGGHLIYAIDLPVDDGGLVKRVLEQLSKRFTTPSIKVDEKVFNPARISKMYGTLTRKGEDTADRPHRVARVLRAPDLLVVVTKELLDAFAPATTATPKTSAANRPGNGNGNGYHNNTQVRFDLDAWIAQHLPDAVAQAWSEGRKWLLPVCPFNSDHSRREAYVTEKHGGMIAAGCQHESCFKSWRELRLHFEPDAYRAHEERLRDAGRRAADAGSTDATSDRVPPPEVLFEDPAYQAEIETFAARDREDPPPAEPRPDADPRPKEWPEPRPLPGRALALVPAFDLDLLPRELRFWVEDAAERMQVAPDIIAVAAMCALSIVVANARTIHPKRYDNWRVYPVLWGVAIAPAGSMKSPAIAIVEKLIAKVEIAERERHEGKRYERQAAEMLGKAQEEAIRKTVKAAVSGKGDPIDPKALAAQLREQDQAAATNAKQRRLRTTDATVEKLGMLVENGKRRCRPMIVWCDELGGLLHSFEREGRESDRDFYLAGWSVANHTVDRVARGSLFLRDLAVSIFGAMTPGPFEKYVREATGGESADGFLQRMQLMVYPDQSREWKPIDRTPDRHAEHRAMELFERLFAIDEDDEHGRPPALRFTSEAQDLFDGWFSALEHRLRDPENGLSEARRSHLAKYRSLMPAIALVCHLADGPGAEIECVSIGAARRAIAWCAYLEAHADRVYSLANDNAWLDGEIVRRIQTGKLAGSIKLRKIQRALPDSVKADDVAAACEVLEEHGWLVLEPVKPKIGRPYIVAHINPRGASS